MPPRKPLTRKRVLDAAIRLADKQGIEAVTMRKLARSLGVEAMSLYNHVKGKDDVLNGMIETIAAEIDLPTADVDWQEALRRCTASYRDVLVAHPWASSVWMGAGDAASLDYADALLGTLRRAGLGDDAIFHAYHVLQAYVLGFVRLYGSVPQSHDDLAGIAAQYLETFPADRYPDFAEHVHQHLHSSHGERGGFELGLDLILDGLARLR